MEHITLYQSIEKFEKDAEYLKDVIFERILMEKENPNINVISDNPKCFIVSVRDVISHDNMSPEYHSFSAQYEIIVDHLKNKHLTQVKKDLLKIINEGKLQVTPGFMIRFHPDVIDNINNILFEKHAIK